MDPLAWIITPPRAGPVGTAEPDALSSPRVTPRATARAGGTWTSASRPGCVRSRKRAGVGGQRVEPLAAPARRAGRLMRRRPAPLLAGRPWLVLVGRRPAPRRASGSGDRTRRLIGRPSGTRARRAARRVIRRPGRVRTRRTPPPPTPPPPPPPTPPPPPPLPPPP